MSVGGMRAGTVVLFDGEVLGKKSHRTVLAYMSELDSLPANPRHPRLVTLPPPLTSGRLVRCTCPRHTRCPSFRFRVSKTQEPVLFVYVYSGPRRGELGVGSGREDGTSWVGGREGNSVDGVVGEGRKGMGRTEGEKSAFGWSQWVDGDVVLYKST